MATSEAQKRAIANWRKKNKEAVKHVNYKSDAKNFIKKEATIQDLLELQQLLKERFKMVNIDQIEGKYVQVHATKNGENESGFAVIDDKTGKVFLDNTFKYYDRGQELIIDKDGNIDEDATQKILDDKREAQRKADAEYEAKYKETMSKQAEKFKPYFGKEIFSKKKNMKCTVTDEYWFSRSNMNDLDKAKVYVIVEYEDGLTARWSLEDIQSHFD